MLTYLIERQKTRPGNYANSPAVIYWAKVGKFRAATHSEALNRARGLYLNRAVTLRVTGIEFYAR